MNSSLQVTFQGACAFVPDTPFFVGLAKGKPTNISILFPDLELPDIALFSKDAGGGAPPVIRGSHMTALVFPITQFDSGSDLQPDLTFYDRRTRREMGLVRLVDYWRISFHGLIQGTPLTFDGAPPDADGTLKGSQSSLWWLTRMMDLDSNHAYAKKIVGPSVNAEVEVSAGHLTVSGFHESPLGAVIWDFGTVAWDGKYYVLKASKVQQFIGNRVNLNADLRSRVADIFLDRFNYSGKRRVISLIASDLRPRVDLSIVNMEIEGILGISDSPSLNFGNFNQGDADFEALYRLSTYDQKLPGPIPVRTTGADGDKARPCAPCAFEGSK